MINLDIVAGIEFEGQVFNNIFFVVEEIKKELMIYTLFTHILHVSIKQLGYTCPGLSFSDM